MDRRRLRPSNPPPACNAPASHIPASRLPRLEGRYGTQRGKAATKGMELSSAPRENSPPLQRWVSVREANQVPSGTKDLSSLTGLAWLIWPGHPAINGWAIFKKSSRKCTNRSDCSAKGGSFLARFARFCGKSSQVPVYEQLTNRIACFQLRSIKAN